MWQKVHSTPRAVRNACMASCISSGLRSCRFLKTCGAALPPTGGAPGGAVCGAWAHSGSTISIVSRNRMETSYNGTEGAVAPNGRATQEWRNSPLLMNPGESERRGTQGFFPGAAGDMGNTLARGHG